DLCQDAEGNLGTGRSANIETGGCLQTTQHLLANPLRTQVDEDGLGTASAGDHRHICRIELQGSSKQPVILTTTHARRNDPGITLRTTVASTKGWPSRLSSAARSSKSPVKAPHPSR